MVVISSVHLALQKCGAIKEAKMNRQQILYEIEKERKVASNPIDRFIWSFLSYPPIFTGGVRWKTEKLALSDVCPIGRKITSEEADLLCNAFRSQVEVGPGMVYLAQIGAYAWIPDDTSTVEQRMEQKLPGTQWAVKHVSVVDQGGHPNPNGMANQHNRKGEDGKVIFRPVFDTTGKLVERQSYTPEQMKMARVPKQGFWLCFNYPEAYQEAFDTSWKLKVVQETTGYSSYDECSWLGMKNVRVLDWDLFKIHPSGKETSLLPDVAKIPFNHGKSCALITFGKGVAAVSPNTGSKWTVGMRGGDTTVGNMIQGWDSEAIVNIKGGSEILLEVNRIIESRKEDTRAIQVLIETRLDAGKCVELKEVIEYNYFDSEKMW